MLTQEIWLLRLSREASSRAQHIARLNPQELHNSQQIKDPRKRLEFIVSRSALKDIGSMYLNTEFNSIRIFSRNDGPYFVCSRGCATVDEHILFQSDHTHSLKFSLSHSGDVCALAFSCGPRIGIDVESVQSTLSLLPLAKRYLPSATYEWLQTFELKAQRLYCLQAWTAFEALLKAGGFARLTPPHHLTAQDQYVESVNGLSWLFNSFLIMDETYVGTLVTESNSAVDFKIRQWSLTT